MGLLIVILFKYYYTIDAGYDKEQTVSSITYELIFKLLTGISIIIKSYISIILLVIAYKIYWNFRYKPFRW